MKITIDVRSSVMSPLLLPAILAAFWIAPATWAQTTTISITPTLPFVDLDIDRSIYDLKPGEIDFHIDTTGSGKFDITGSVSLQAPGMLSGVIGTPSDPDTLVFSQPTTFTSQQSISGADSVGITVYPNQNDMQCTSFGPCTFTNIFYFHSTPPQVGITTTINLRKNGFLYKYDVNFYWNVGSSTTAPCGSGSTNQLKKRARTGVRPADDTCPDDVSILSIFPKQEETLWEYPATFPDFQVQVQYTATADGQIGIQLLDQNQKILNTGDQTVKIAKGNGTVTIPMTSVAVPLSTDNPNVFMEAVLTTNGPDGTPANTTPSNQVHYTVGFLPRFLAQVGCSNDGSQFQPLGNNAITWPSCRPALEFDYTFPGTDDAVLTVDKQWFSGSSLRGRSTITQTIPRPSEPDSNSLSTAIVPIETSQLTVPRNADSYTLKLKLRNKGTLQLVTGDAPVQAHIEEVYIQNCSPPSNSPLDVSAAGVGCNVEISTFNNPGTVTRQIITSGVTSADGKQFDIPANTQKVIQDTFQLGTGNGAFSQTTVSYALQTSNLAVSAIDSVHYFRLVQSLDGAIQAVGPDKIDLFIGGSLLFLNGQHLPGKLGKIIKTANEVCNGSTGLPTVASTASAAADVLSGKHADCLTKAIQAARVLLPHARLSATAATPTIGLLGIASTWAFDTPQPNDGSFAADMTLQFSAQQLPDNPDFDESRLQIVAWDPVSGVFEILPTQLDLANRKATAHLSHLSPYYSLAMVGPLSTTILRTPVLFAGGSLNSAIALTNLGAASASGQLSALAADGTLFGDPANRATLNVAAGGQAGGTADSLLNSGTLPLSDSLVIGANQPAVSGVNMLGGSTMLEALPLQSEGNNAWVLSLVEQNDSYITAIHVANSANSATPVDFELHAADGTSLGTYSTSLVSKGKLEMSLSGMFPNLQEPFTGYLAMTAGQNVTAAALIMSDLALAAVPGKSAVSGSLNSPLVGARNTTVTLSLVNLGTQDAAVAINAYAADGTVLPAAHITVGAGRLYSGTLAQVFGNDPGAVSLSIQSTQATLMGDVTLSDATGLGRFRTTVPLSAGQAGLVIPYLAGSGTTNNISVTNASGNAANATLTLYGADGSTVSTQPLSMASYASSLIKAATGAYAIISSDQPVTAVALLDPGIGDIAAVVGIAAPGGSTVTPPGNSPAISAPTTIDFGTVTLGQKVPPMTFNVSNSGGGTLTVSSLTAPGSPFSLLSPAANTTPFNVPAAGTPFMIGFAPTAVGAPTDKLLIATNDPANPTWTVNLKGNVVAAPAPAITLSSGNLNFGNVALGQTPGSLTLTVTNSGNVAVTVTAKTAAPFAVSPASLPLAVGQNGTLTVTFTPAAVGAAIGSLTVSIGSPNDPKPVALTGTGVLPTINETTIRSMVYHEVTRFAKNQQMGAPVMSASGNRMVYFAPDPTTPQTNDIFVVNNDGSGLRMVDSYKQNCDCASTVDISADGNTVVSTDSVEVRIASATASAGKRLTLKSNVTWLRISPKADKVFFIQRLGDASTNDPTTERGVYVINADGSGLKQVAGPKTVSALLGTTPDKVFPFSTDGWSLDVSADGAKVIFGVAAPGGERILSVNADGTGVKQLIGPYDFVVHAALSADATKVAYDVLPANAPNEVGVINYDGSGRKALATNVNATSSLRMVLSSDGSKLLYGDSNRLYLTDGSGLLTLSVQGGSYSSEPAMLINGTFGQASMNSAADRFAYVIGDDTGVPQLATLDLNTATLGEAPVVSSPTLSQSTIALSGASSTTVSTAVKTSDKVTRVSAAVLSAGSNDSHVNGPVLLDDGTQGDLVKGDGIYTSNQLTSDCCAALGTRTVRVKAEVRDSGNRRHATAIEFGGLTVVSK